MASAVSQESRGAAGQAPSRWGAWAPWVAWGTVAVIAAMVVAALVLLLSSRGVPIPPPFGFRGHALPIAAVSSVVGGIVAGYRPTNPVGWLLLGEALVAAVAGLSFELAVLTVIVRPGELPGGELFAWLDSWLWAPILGIPSVILLLFPNGRLPSARWRPVFVLAVVGVVGASVAVALTPGFINFPVEVDDMEFGIAGTSVPPFVAFLPLAVALPAALASLVARFRSAGRTERQQIKWLAFAGAFIGLAVVINHVEVLVRGGYDLPSTTNTLVVVSTLGLPVAIAFAILRYRLYDIDFLISRTLVYGPLTAILAGTYTGAILFFRLVFVGMLSIGSDAAVATTAFLVAALFIPVRNALQAWVDRYFKEDDYKRLSTFSAEAARVAELTSQETIARRFLTLAASASGASCARIVLNHTHNGPGVFQEGEGMHSVKAEIPLTFNGTDVGRLELGPPRDGDGYRQRQMEVLERAARSVAQALYHRAA